MHHGRLAHVRFGSKADIANNTFAHSLSSATRLRGSNPAAIKDGDRAQWSSYGVPLREARIAELNESLHDRGIKFCFAELKDPVKDKLKRFGLFAQLGESCFFPTVGAAVASYLENNDVEWVDWEDEAGKATYQP